MFDLKFIRDNPERVRQAIDPRVQVTKRQPLTLEQHRLVLWPKPRVATQQSAQNHGDGRLRRRLV